MIVYAVDFDGTLCFSNFPDLGEPNMDIIDFCLDEQIKGNKIILWTCRENELLAKAVEFCKEYGLVFDSVNANLPERIALYGNDCRKIGADYFIDDKNIFFASAYYVHMED